MSTEEELLPSAKYLVTTCYFATRMVDKVKEDVKNFMADKEKNDQYFQFINWQQQKNEVAVLTMYAYANILLPQKFDTIFQINNPDNYVYSEFTVTQAIFNGWTATNRIDRGHKHIIILEFLESIPGILNLLSSFGNKTFSSELELGFCNKQNFKQIKEVINNKYLNKPSERTT